MGDDAHQLPPLLHSLFQLSGFRLAVEDALKLPVDLVTSEASDRVFLDTISRDEDQYYTEAYYHRPFLTISVYHIRREMKRRFREFINCTTVYKERNCQYLSRALYLLRFSTRSPPCFRPDCTGAWRRKCFFIWLLLQGGSLSGQRCGLEN
mgnify:CR=1 FL=1